MKPISVLLFLLLSLIQISYSQKEIHEAYGQAQTLMVFKYPVKALALIRNSIERNPNVDSFYRLRGEILMDLKRYEDALLDFYKFEKMCYCTQPRVYTKIGTSKAELLDYAGALLSFRLAISIDPNFVEAYYERVLLKLKLKDFRGAIVDCNECIRMERQYFHSDCIKLRV